MDTNGSSQAPAQGLGPLIRMQPLKASELPSHPSLADLQAGKSAKYVQAFAASALDEAEQFMTTYLLTFKSKGRKSSPPSSADVEVYAKDIPSHELAKIVGTAASPSESWFARKSIHENRSAPGTASWEDFNTGLRYNHSQHEKDYTPGVIDAFKILDWASIIDDGQHVDMGGWTELTASVMEMVHKIPSPLQNRVFPVFVITAKKGDVFLVVQIPVSTEGLNGTRYHNDPKVTTGMYCSIERCELKEGGDKVEWQMATASDAKGSLPMFVQKLGVPGAVVKDVGLFLKWTAERRTS